MTDSSAPSRITRRALIVTGVAAACAATIGGLRFAAAGADASPAERTAHFDEALKSLLAGRIPVEGGVAVELPEIAENGNFVPITIAVDSPMTADDHVKAVHVLSAGNPVARVATFQLSALNAVARVQSRMRLARTQDVVVVAELSTGEVRMSTMTVKVTIGGCAS